MLELALVFFRLFRRAQYALIVDVADDDSRRARLLRIVIHIAMGAMAVLTLFDVIRAVVYFQPQALRNSILSGVVVMLALVGVLYLCRAGRVRLAGYMLGVLHLAVGWFADPVELDRLLAIYAVPTLTASFTISPASSLFFALLSCANYTLVYVLGPRTREYNHVFVISLLVLAFIAWLAAVNLEDALRRARQALNRECEAQKQVEKLNQDLERRVDRRTAQLDTIVAEMEHEIAERKWAEELLRKARDELEVRVVERTARLIRANDDLKAEVAERRRSEKIQACMYAISEAAHSAQTLDALFGSIHSTVEQLMPASNFYIALYDPASELLSFPYFVDEHDAAPPPRAPGKGLTEYVLRTGAPLLAPPQVFRELVERGEADVIGTMPLDWLGVPLKTGDVVIGVLVVQSYTEGVRFGENEKNMLVFVSSQAAMAIERKRAEVALRQSEEFNRAVIENSPIGISVRSRTGRLLAYNEAWRKIWAMPDEALAADLNRHRDELVFDEKDTYLGSHAGELQQLYQEGGSLYLPELRTTQPRPGGAQWVSQYFYAIKDECGRVERVVIMTEDVTARKQTEQDLQWELAVNAALSALYKPLISPASSVQDITRIVLERARQLTGSDQGCICIPDASAESGVDGALEGQHVLRVPVVLDGALVSQIILSNPERDYMARDVEAVRRLAEFYALGIQRMRIETALRESEKRYYGLFENSPISIWEEDFSEVKRFVDSLRASGVQDFKSHFEQHPDDVSRCVALVRILDVNQATLDFYQVSDKETFRKGLARFFVGDSYHIFREEVIALAEGQTTFESEVRTQTLQGVDKLVVFRLSIASGCEATWSRAVVSFVDITERKRMEEELKASLQVKETLLKEIHHRVKNNLQVVVSLLNWHAKYVRDPQSLAVFRESQNRIRSMAFVHQCLYQSTDLAQVDFAEYVRKLTEHLFRAFGVNSETVALTVDVEDVSLSIDDAIPCGLIVNELVSNCLKYAFPAAAEGTARNKYQVRVRMHSAQDWVTLSVSDNGVGFPKEVDFRRTESLGMQLVILLTDQLKGQVTLDKGDGTSFVVTFPKARAKRG